MKYPDPYRSTGHGFTLVEIAIVLFIVALLMGGLLPTLSGQIDQRRNSDTSKQLSEIKDALIGFAIINGRLPCPAAPNTTGVESQTGLPGTGSCTNFYNGFVPAATLGLAGTDSAGYVVDSWGNRIHYAVTSWNSASPVLNDVFTTSNGMSIVGISNLLPTSLAVCSSSAGISSSSCGSSYWLTSSATGVPAVIFSTGKNGAQGSAGPDEAANLAGYPRFVSHLPTGNGTTGGYFDDIVIWISPNVLINRMVAAGKLP